jgi:sulfhydrogenase subunit beta (sulfur reductase)
MPGERGFLSRAALQALFNGLARAGYRCFGPRVRDEAIVYEELEDARALPVDYGDHQGPGSYRLEPRTDGRCFAWANGPQALKPLLFRPSETLWRAVRAQDGEIRYEGAVPEVGPRAVIGVRACDLAALALQDKHFLGGAGDPWYGARRADLLLVAVDCSHPADTCFCASTGDGPEVGEGADLALSELDDGFLVRACTETGEALWAHLPLEDPGDERLDQARRQIVQAERAQGRRIPGRNLRDALFANLAHPRWDDVSGRCLSCGNCVAVCPTCFCHIERDRVSLNGHSDERERQWDSCYSAEHSFLHGRPLRQDTRTRYRQWLTHKLGGWHDQYGRSGCVGCGRCIAWCPVGIDITEEAAYVCAASTELQTP